MTLSYRNAVAVGTIVFYVPACAVGIYLLVLHGYVFSTVSASLTHVNNVNTTV